MYIFRYTEYYNDSSTYALGTLPRHGELRHTVRVRRQEVVQVVARVAEVDLAPAVPHGQLAAKAALELDKVGTCKK